MSIMVLRGDARQLPLADESVHLVVTSPPYNARLRYDGYEDWLPWEDYWHGLIETSMRECFRVLVHGGRIAINLANVIQTDIGVATRVIRDKRAPAKLRHRLRNGQWHLDGSGGNPWAVQVAEHIWPLLREIGFLPRETLNWVKGDDAANLPTHSTAWGTWCSARNPVLRSTAEPIFIASKGTHAREPGQSDLTAAEFKAWTRNAWLILPTGREAHVAHPAMFPLELPRRLIKLYSYVGDVVLDPFVGSGTTLAAARVTGRHGIGLDTSERYCRLAAARNAQGLLPLEFCAIGSASPSGREPREAGMGSS